MKTEETEINVNLFIYAVPIAYPDYRSPDESVEKFYEYVVYPFKANWHPDAIFLFVASTSVFLPGGINIKQEETRDQREIMQRNVEWIEKVISEEKPSNVVDINSSLVNDLKDKE